MSNYTSKNNQSNSSEILFTNGQHENSDTESKNRATKTRIGRMRIGREMEGHCADSQCYLCLNELFFLFGMHLNVIVFPVL